ncbi:MAG TPA: sigma factor-like helix-turn-helix DNA-binding protein [Phycisphaerales bacterium]|nr:sigma factor-like helix-turn-helix DNA-binding protein [Phycisphaerales bacterium]
MRVQSSIRVSKRYGEYRLIAKRGFNTLVFTAYTVVMALQQRACERRVYRLATLLTGSHRAGGRVLLRVLQAQPRLVDLDDAHMDRLTVLSARELAGARFEGSKNVNQYVAAVAGLTSQQREAWTFCRLYGLNAREAAKAMDCSWKAVQSHLTSAEHALAGLLGDEDRSQCEAVVLAESVQTDVPEVVIHRARVTRLAKKASKSILIIAAIGVLTLIFIWCRRIWSP